MSEAADVDQEIQTQVSRTRRLEEARGLILLVEDDPAAREAMSELLSEWGYQVLDVGSAEEAEYAIRKKVPDAAIVDVLLPGRSGDNLMSRLREKFPKALLIGVSGMTDAAVARRCKGLGADRFLGKPIAPEALAEALHGGRTDWH